MSDNRQEDGNLFSLVGRKVVGVNITRSHDDKLVRLHFKFDGDGETELNIDVHPYKGGLGCLFMRHWDLKKGLGELEQKGEGDDWKKDLF